MDYLPTGTVIHRRILVMNQEAQTAHFFVYPDAAHISNGLFTGDAGATRSELTGWISVQHPAVTLRPGTSATDMVTIKVPPGATRGEHYAVIWVQQAAYVRAASGFGVNDVARVGIRVYLAVGRGGAPPTNFTITTITGRRSVSGRPSILVHVDNTGGRAVDLNGTARLTGGPGNTSAGPFRAQQIITLAPGQSGNMTFGPPESLPNGPWQASITLVSGLTTAAATASIQFGALASHPGLSLMAWLGMLSLPPSPSSPSWPSSWRNTPPGAAACQPDARPGARPAGTSYRRGRHRAGGLGHGVRLGYSPGSAGIRSRSSVVGEVRRFLRISHTASPARRRKTMSRMTARIR